MHDPPWSGCRKVDAKVTDRAEEVKTNVSVRAGRAVGGLLPPRGCALRSGAFTQGPRLFRGPYRRWVHEHTFEARDGGVPARDRVLVVGPDVRRIFRYQR